MRLSNNKGGACVMTPPNQINLKIWDNMPNTSNEGDAADV